MSNKWTPLTKDMLNSKAFWALSGSAAQVLIAFLMKRKFAKTNKSKLRKKFALISDDFTFSYKEAEKEYGLTIPRFKRAIADLMAKGFIMIKHQGGTYKKDKTIYKLSDRYLLWRDGAVIFSKTKDIKRGFQGKNKSKSSNIDD